jgi:U3 small nucleolar RNA-associated protein 12
MVKTYLSYILSESLGQITNSKIFALSKDNKVIFTSFNDYIMGFDIKSGQEVFKFRDQNIKVTSLHTLSNSLIIGYDNGSLYILSNLEQNLGKKSLIPNKENRTFIHQKGILCINSNINESRLVIGSVDKLISVVDIISNLIVYKLSGHKEKINDIAFYKNNEQFIFSISDDFCFKIWDTNIQKCIYTHSDTANKLTSFINLDNTLLFGTFSQEINIFEIHLDKYLESDIDNKLNFSQSEILVSKGTLKKLSNSKTISFYNNDEIFIVLSVDSSIEMFKILKKKEIKAKLVKNYMHKKKINFLEAQSEAMDIYKQKKYDYKFRFKSIFKFEENSKTNKKNSKSKIFSIFLLDDFKFGYITNQNSIEIYKYYSNLLIEKIYSINNDTKKVETLDQEKDDLSVKKIYSIGQNIGGHHSQINIIKYSPSNQEFYSVSNDEIKLWGGKDLTKPLKSQTIKNITCIAFEQDKNILLACTKKGSLYLLNMVSLEIIKTFDKIHSAQISEIIALPYREEKHIIITCSYDKTVKFWNLEEVDNNEINLDYENEMNALEAVVCAKVTSDLNFFSYALYDNTIKIYYFDTMKFHLSLYGHKMPVTNYDISSDGALLVSGGLDKSIKIWGMDFGDCHKTLPAHNDIVTCVQFIKDTHFFISCSKDCTMKYYDADTFEFISLLTNDLLCNQFLWLDINSEGTQIISSCNDNSIKIFNISQEQVVPKLTQQELLEKNIIKEEEKEFNNKNNINNTNKLGENDENVTGQMIKKMDHLTYAENLIEKINLCEKFKEDVIQYQMEIDEFIKNTKLVNDDQNKIKDVKIYNLNISMEKPRPNILLFGKNIFQVILEEIKKIPYFDLENVLNNISYAYFQKLVYYFEHYIRKNIEIELIGRCIIFFCNLYESQISNDKVIMNMLRSIYLRLQGRFKLKYSLIKFNQKSIELIVKKFQDFQKNKNLMEDYNIKNNNIIDSKE